MDSTMLRAPLALLMLAVLTAACGETKDKAPGEVAAIVDRHEIGVRQVEQVLQQQQRGLRPEQAEAAGRQVLERLIDQQLAVQKAGQLKLADEPRVAQALEAARREVLARAYLEKVGEGAATPTPDEVQKFYEERPQLFAQRRVYNLQELVIEARPEQVAALREQLANSRSIAEYVEWLRANDFRFGANQPCVRPSSWQQRSFTSMQRPRASTRAMPSPACANRLR